MKAIIIGAGKIGRGFLAQLLAANKVPIYFAEKDAGLVRKLNEKGRYTVHILGNEEKSSEIDGYHAFTLEDTAAFANAWQESSLIFTSVGGKNLKSIGQILAGVFKEMLISGKIQKSTIITCENWKNPGKDLRLGILDHLTETEKRLFEEHVAITQAVIMRTATNPSEEQQKEHPLDLWVQDFWDLPIDKEPLLEAPPALKYFRYIDNFGRFLDQKIFTNNTSNAAVAYYGYLRGFTYAADAANDPEVERLMDGVYAEINEMIVKEMGVSVEDQEAFSKKAKKKYQDRALVDELVRHGADPLRKIGPDDRLVAPGRLCLKHGIKPESIAFVLAAALYFDYLGDESAVELKRLRETYGLAYVLEKVSGLSSEEPLYNMVLSQVEVLREKGVVHD